MKVAFIGLGNMGAGLAKVVAKELDATDLLLVNRSPQRWRILSDSMGERRLSLNKPFKRLK